ncbi:uncharacterized protein FOBCDRAFT_228354 [Fusarium oxysporum Fo47]|uniref:uncharacterized protein n=1 Tax=Fusarium oxysporum Fo47 TaxID=660027 RepID=UPI0028698813|nr:uncharacterized protein FOBCDRAFT_228354 [Fusarium oxysporum Fo47]QJS76594.2 hypothetical protein FOBCDRAFT_228354 [Fusarium oxysporum Fo47]
MDHNLTRTLRYRRALLVSTAASAPLATRFWRIISGAERRDKLQLSAGKQSRQHWLLYHIQQDVLFQSWTVNNIRSWLVSADDHFSGRSVPSNVLLQASPDPIKLFAQKLFAEEHAHLDNQQNGDQRLRGGETPISLLRQCC